MKYLHTLLLILIAANLLNAQEANTIHHRLYANVSPTDSKIEVIDSIRLSQKMPTHFLLNAHLEVRSLNPEINIRKITSKIEAKDVGMDREEEQNKIALTRWEISGNSKDIVLRYQGIIDGKLESSKEEYQRGFAETSGIISQEGTYLAGSTYWVPQFEDTYMTYSLTSTLPSSWRTVSQGKRIYEKEFEENHIDTWLCSKPQEEIFLIAAQFSEYTYTMNSGIEAMAFLRGPDEGLANKYLEVTEQYMEMYQEMLGKYPYSKFALVENFWETGYGMPSFTLLGEKIIRFPFILHSSYPHELLHNWWGNSVYVDFESGNWCEGTTAFMADHLIKEQRGAGEEYRRSTLQKFSNFVTEENDFPLNKFIARHDGPSEAIGYGKALMIWQMLRRKLGDETFLKGMQFFYKNFKFKTASYQDIKTSMEEVSKQDLTHFFDQWINRKGAPELAIGEISKDTYGDSYRISIQLLQVQNEKAFDINVPINIATKKGIETFVFFMNQKSQTFQINLKDKPLKLVVDAQYDLFRILNPAEVPPTLSKIWGSADNLFILPSKADKIQKNIYLQFAKQWQEKDADHFSIVYDDELKKLPTDKTAWVLGFENLFAKAIDKQLQSYNSGIDATTVQFGKKKILKNTHSFVITLFKEEDISKQNIFIAFDNRKAIEGLIRKLPHYGKYSYLAFQGDEPTNVAKGQWEVINSPLTKIFEDTKAGIIQEREALAKLKPVFSEKKMMESIRFLASGELQGRGLGTPELDKAALYIAHQFEEAGLQALGEDYYQTFTHQFKEKGKLKLKNVIGIIPGTDASIRDEIVVISAHYDHLGLGWPDVHKGDEGKIHFGADDNASGVSILIELARTMAKSVKPKRTILFLASSGEEAGLIGSRYFVKHRKDFFKGEIFANVNLDTDGSLFDKKLMVLNANTAKEWKFIFMGTDYTTGIKSEVIEQNLDASDQVAFIENGIPAIQLFTGATPNYHRPTDVAGKIDGKGLVKVAIVAKEVISYLADREDAMPFTGNGHNPHQKTTNKSANRKVSTGSVPDFAYRGEGVKIGSVIPGSVGEKAGLKANDIIIAMDNTTVDNLKTYSILLKNHHPGDLIHLKVKRNGKEKDITLTLSER